MASTNCIQLGEASRPFKREKKVQIFQAWSNQASFPFVFNLELVLVEL